MKKHFFFLFIILLLEVFWITPCYAENEDPTLQESYDELKTQYEQLKRKYNSLLKGQTTAQTSRTAEDNSETDGNSLVIPFLCLIIIIEFIVIRIKSRRIKKARNLVVGKAAKTLKDLEEKSIKKKEDLKTIEDELAQKHRLLEEVNNSLDQHKDNSPKPENVVRNKPSEADILDENVDNHKVTNKEGKPQTQILYWP